MQPSRKRRRKTLSKRFVEDRCERKERPPEAPAGVLRPGERSQARRRSPGPEALARPGGACPALPPRAGMEAPEGDGGEKRERLEAKREKTQKEP